MPANLPNGIIVLISVAYVITCEVLIRFLVSPNRPWLRWFLRAIFVAPAPFMDEYHIYPFPAPWPVLLFVVSNFGSSTFPPISFEMHLFSICLSSLVFLSAAHFAYVYIRHPQASILKWMKWALYVRGVFLVLTILAFATPIGILFIYVIAYLENPWASVIMPHLLSLRPSSYASQMALHFVCGTLVYYWLAVIFGICIQIIHYSRSFTRTTRSSAS